MKQEIERWEDRERECTGFRQPVAVLECVLLRLHINGIGLQLWLCSLSVSHIGSYKRLKVFLQGGSE